MSLASAPLFAQNNASVVVDNFSTNIASAYYVGQFGTNNSLIVTNAGNVTITGSGGFFVGGGTSAHTNLVVVTDPNSILQMNSPFLYMGWAGSGNRMIITNGGTVLNSSSTLFNRIGSGGDNNVVTVTGSGSVWTNGGGIAVGRTATGNGLRIEDGGQVFSTQGWIGGAGDGDNVSQASTNNFAVVTGSGSLWQNSADLTVGHGSTSYGNYLIISNGGRVVSTFGKIGHQGDVSSVVVTGVGSAWSNTVNPGGNLGLWLGGSGRSNQLTIADGGRVDTAGDFLAGQSSTSVGNTMLITGSNSLLHVNGLSYFGSNSDGNQGTLSNGGRMVSLNAMRIGNASGGSNTQFVVTDTGSVLSNASVLYVGDEASYNRLRIENGGRTYSTQGILGNGTGGQSNVVLVSGAGSLWQNSSGLTVGLAGSANQVVVTNGGNVVSETGIIGSAGHFNSVLVTGAGATWSNTFVGGPNIGLLVGANGDSNRLVIANGGFVHVANDSFVGVNSGSDYNSVQITGSNSLLNIEGYFYLGWNGVANDLLISDGGRLHVNGTAEITSIGGNGASAGNNTALVTGLDSVLSSRSSAFYVGDAGDGNRLTVSNGALVTATAAITVGGSGGAGATDNSAFVTDQGVLETGVGLTAGIGTGNSISNVGGVYQFTTAAPTITPNGAGRIAITDGTISYRDVSAANIFNTQVANISFAGDNAFRLNNSSNSSITAYTFDTGLGATNYHRLELVNGTTRWTTTGGTTIGVGGSLLASNTMATFAGTLTIHGSYVSDPSTNTFLDDVTIGQSGMLAGGVGDLFDFKQSLFIHSTNATGFNLANSAVSFSGGGMHTNAITGMDLGGGVAAWDAAFSYETNFAYGELHLGSASDQICFTCGNIPTVASNGLYIGWLDLLGNAGLVTNLHAASTINLYYDATDTRNAYLGGLTYALTDCDLVTAGGLLMPVIPEPTVIMLLGMGALLLRRRRVE